MTKPTGEYEFMQSAWKFWQYTGHRSYISKSADEYLEFIDSNIKPDKPVLCANCMIEIPFHPSHVSHILPKSTYPSYRLDIRNVKPLCFSCHDTYGNGRKRAMLIWKDVEEVIQILKQEYHGRHSSHR